MLQMCSLVRSGNQTWVYWTVILTKEYTMICLLMIHGSSKACELEMRIEIPNIFFEVQGIPIPIRLACKQALQIVRNWCIH